MSRHLKLSTGLVANMENLRFVRTRVCASGLDEFEERDSNNLTKSVVSGRSLRRVVGKGNFSS